MSMATLRTALVLGLVTGTALAQAPIPDINIALAFRQREEEKLSASVHLFELWCETGRCDLTVTTLNQCVGGIFVPKVERTSNMKLAGQREAKLHVHYTSNGLLQLHEDIGGGQISYVLKFREAKTPGEQFQSHSSLFPQDDPAVHKLVMTDFKGGMTQYSDILGQVSSVEYVPLVDEHFTAIKLACDVSVPGTVSLKTKP
jgi:hypothetical protein